MPIKLPSNEEANVLVGSGIEGLAAGIDMFAGAEEKRTLAFNFAQETSSALTDAKSALFMGRQQANIARIQGAELKGKQISAQSASGFVANAASNAAQIRKTESDVARVVANIEFSTADRINTLEFRASVADANSRFNESIADINAEVGIAKSAIGLAVAGYGAYTKSQGVT